MDWTWVKEHPKTIIIVCIGAVILAIIVAVAVTHGGSAPTSAPAPAPAGMIMLR